MINPVVAGRLLAHARPGKVTDMLYEAAPTLGSRTDCQPSDEVLLRTKGQLQMDQLVRLLEKTTSVALLRACARDRRVGVRCAVASNTLVPDDVLTDLARLVLKAEDPLARAMREGTSTRPELRARLLLDWARLRDETWPDTMAGALAQGATSDLVENMCTKLGAHQVQMVLRRVNVWGGDKLQNEHVLRLIKAADYTDQADHDLHKLLAQVLKNDPSPEMQHAVTETVGTDQAKRHLMVHAAKGQGTKTPMELIRGEDGDTLEVLMNVYHSSGGTTDAEMAGHLLTSNLSTGTHARMRCTPEARLILARHPDKEVSGVHVAQVEDPSTQAKLLQERGTSEGVVRVDVERVEKLWEAGLRGVVLEDLAQSAMPLKGELSESLQAHLVKHASTNFVARATLTQRYQLDALMRRDDLDTIEVNRALARLLIHVDTYDHAHLDALSPPSVLLLLKESASDDDIVRYLLTQTKNADVNTYTVETTLGQSAWITEPWRQRVVPYVKLPWAQVTSQEVLKGVHDLLDEAFGDDTELWGSALVLYSDWVGTIPELVDAVKMLQGSTINATEES